MSLFNNIAKLSTRICKIQNCRTIFTSQKVLGIYEPDYLEVIKAKYPTYESLDVRMTGHDYPVLESYQRFVHRIADTLDLDVSECWASPPKKTQIQRYKPSSAIVESDYKLTTYERYVQISDMQAPIYPVFLRFIQEALPEGVTLSIVKHTDEIEETRYVPDKDLLDLKKELDTMGGPVVSKKR